MIPKKTGTDTAYVQGISGESFDVTLENITKSFIIVDNASDAIKALSWELNSKEKEQLDLAKKDCQARMPGNPFISE